MQNQQVSALEPNLKMFIVHIPLFDSSKLFRQTEVLNYLLPPCRLGLWELLKPHRRNFSVFMGWNVTSLLSKHAKVYALEACKIIKL